MLLLIGCAGSTADVSSSDDAPLPRLSEAQSWALQLSGYERSGAFDRLARAQADVVVIDPIRSVRGRETFPVAAVVSQIHSRPGPKLPRRLVLAYLNVAQWEDYRVGADEVPEDLLLGEDPDGWSGHRQVRYWDARWQELLIGPGGAVEQLLADGFDGVFLDWVLGYHEATVKRAAEAEGVDPRREMATLLARIDAAGERLRPGFVVVAQNAAELGTTASRLTASVDGVTAEPVRFGGRADAAWESAESAGSPLPDAHRALVTELLTAARDAGFVTLALDYATSDEQVGEAEAHARSIGAIPFVSRTPLDRLPDRVVAPR